MDGLEKHIQVIISLIILGILYFGIYSIDKIIFEYQLEKSCETDGWYLTENYRFVCQDINE